MAQASLRQPLGRILVPVLSSTTSPFESTTCEPALTLTGLTLRVAIVKAWNFLEDDRLIAIVLNIHWAIIDGRENTARRGIEVAIGIQSIWLFAEANFQGTGSRRR